MRRGCQKGLSSINGKTEPRKMEMTILPLLFWSQHTWNIALSTEHGTEFSPNMVKLNSIARWVRRGSFREDTAPDHSMRVKEPGPFGHSL